MPNLTETCKYWRSEKCPKCGHTIRTGCFVELDQGWPSAEFKNYCLQEACKFHEYDPDKAF